MGVCLLVLLFGASRGILHDSSFLHTMGSAAAFSFCVFTLSFMKFFIVLSGNYFKHVQRTFYNYFNTRDHSGEIVCLAMIGGWLACL